MEKLKKYNQFILSILGTITLLFVIGSAIVAFVEYLSYRNYDENIYEPGIIAETKIDSLVKEEKREQILTFSEFVEIDTIQKLYIIPIGQRNLDDAESTGEVLGLINGFSNKVVKGYRNKYGSHYNNLVLFDSATDKTHVIFDTRLSISDFYSFDNGKFLIVRGAPQDTNNDGYIDSYDLQEMYLYNVKDQKPQKIKKPDNTTFINFARGINNMELLFQFGVDRNNDGKFKNKEEPKIYYKLNLESQELNLLIPELQINEIQKLLEGTAK